MSKRRNSMDLFQFLQKLFRNHHMKKGIKQIKIGGEDNVQITPDDYSGDYSQIQIGGKKNKQVIK